MANIVGLALKVTGDASGLAKSLTPVDRALDKLAAQAEKATNVFTPFAEKTAAAGKAQEEFAAKFSALADQLRDNVVGPQEYAAAFGRLTEEAKGAAAAFQEGLRITQQNQTAEQARTASLERLNELLKFGAIDARNFGLESAKLSEGSDSTALDRFAEAIAPLRAALEGGTLSAERFAEQSQEIAAAISGSTPAAERQATAILDLRNRFEAGRVSIEQYREEFSRIQSGDIATTFEVQVVGVREGVDASNELRASLAQLTDTQITAALQVAGVEQLDDLRQQFAGIDGAQIDAVLKVLGVETIEAARQQLESLSNTDASATINIANAAEVQDTIRSIESSFGSLEAAQSRLASLPDVDLKATLEVLGVDSIDAARERLIALGALQIEPKLQTIGFESIDSARAALESLGDRSITATLEFLGTATISDAAEQLATLDGTSVQAFLQATGFDSIEAAQAKLGELQDVDVTATLQLLGVDTIDAARERLASISAVDIEPVLRLIGVDSIESARQQLAVIDGTEIDTQLRVLGVDGIESAAALLSSVEGKNVDLIAKTLGFDSVASLTQAIDAAESKTITFDVASNADEEAASIADLVAEQDAYQAAVAEGIENLLAGGVINAVTSLGVAIDGLGSAFASVQNQISGLVTSANASFNKLDDFSQRTGIGVEALQGYSLAAKLAGVDTEQFGGAIERLAVNIGKATPGDALDKSLRAINLSVGELRALAPEQQFSAIGNAISTLPTVADRAAAAVEIFGKQGAALAPLFREGATSIEELRAQAERLGIIVDETQVENVGSMNDAFGLVAATVQGITGQVLGNLAPAVTDVTNQFLKFVGVDGQGGTGIANAITDTLLRGAEYFAGIFDEYVEYFGGFTGALNTAGETFNRIAGVLEVLSGVFRSIFNTFEIIGNGIAVALGKALEAIGSYVSTDLENFGRDLQLNANAQLQQNLAELEAAGQQIIDGTTQAVFGNAAEQRSAAAGAATTYLEGLRAQIDAERSPQFKVEADIERTRERFDSFFNGIVDQSSAVTDAMRGFEAAAASVVDPLNITAEEIARIKVEQDKVNRAVDKELQSRRAAKDAAIAQADADTKRIEALTKAGDAQTKLADDLAAVEREQARVQEQQKAARQANNSEAAAAAAATLGQLDQLQAKLSDLQQAQEQGFADGFKKTFEATAKSIDDLSRKAEEFGNVGALAAEALRLGVERAQLQARDGILTQETYDREVARQQNLFDQRLAAAQRVEDFLANAFGQRNKAELDAVAKLEERRKQAEVNAGAIAAKIAEQERNRANATNLGERRAATQRIAALRQAERIEAGIAEGRNEVARNQASGLASGFGAAEQFQSSVAQTNDNFLQAFTGTYAAANASLNAANAVAAELARQQELSRPVAGSVATADIRTAEGAALVLGLGAAAQDPNLIEARLQTKQLTGIRNAITNAVSGYLGTVAEIF